jgi:hypothetical protein
MHSTITGRAQWRCDWLRSARWNFGHHGPRQLYKMVGFAILGTELRLERRQSTRRLSHLEPLRARRAHCHFRERRHSEALGLRSGSRRSRWERRQRKRRACALRGDASRASGGRGVVCGHGSAASVLGGTRLHRAGVGPGDPPVRVRPRGARGVGLRVPGLRERGGARRGRRADRAQRGRRPRRPAVGPARAPARAGDAPARAEPGVVHATRLERAKSPRCTPPATCVCRLAAVGLRCPRATATMRASPPAAAAAAGAGPFGPQPARLRRAALCGAGASQPAAPRLLRRVRRPGRAWRPGARACSSSCPQRAMPAIERAG